MEFNSWADLLDFYKKNLMKEKPESVRFIMDRHDDQKIIVYIENEDTQTAKAFSATLTFTDKVELVMIFGFHFFPTKLFKLTEVNC